VVIVLIKDSIFVFEEIPSYASIHNLLPAICTCNNIDIGSLRVKDQYKLAELIWICTFLCSLFLGHCCKYIFLSINYFCFT